MASVNYEEVNRPEKKRRSNCCLKFWLVFFILVALALIGVIIWLLVAPKTAKNANSHPSRNTDGLRTGLENQVTGLCALPAARGPCKANLERFYYDSTTGTCRKFIYGGCSGNDNNFGTLEACKKTCISQPAKAELAPEASKPDFCLAEKDPGPCFAAFRRYAYDKDLDNCIEFIFGGCGGNQNNFESFDECVKQCKGSAEIDVIPAVLTSGTAGDTSICYLPRENGNCRENVNRWGFDPGSGKCIQFKYGGCGGNENNFESLEACEQRCLGRKLSVPLPVPAKINLTGLDDICKLKQDVGPCRGSHKRWYFDTEQGRCMQFYFGGCRGNANNFESKEICEAKCNVAATIKNVEVSKDASMCNLPLERGPCLADFMNWGFDPSSGRCVQFIYGGCGGNANNFETKEACEQQCLANIPKPITTTGLATTDEVCKMPQDTGSCRGSFRRWAYNASKGACVEFIYGGCQGNANNFETQEVCEAMCSGSGGSGAPICYLPHERGNCLAFLRRWGFDPSSGNCIQFVYGGCGGNANNFETKEACELQCVGNTMTPVHSTGRDRDSVCSLAQDAGPCRANIPRWAFDSSKGQCTEFSYGGCQGNANNFETKQLCEAVCGAAVPKPWVNNNLDNIDPVCKMPPDPGPCSGRILHWTFDSSKGTCVQFLYGGCQGNANNFESLEVCKATCSSPMTQPSMNLMNVMETPSKADSIPECQLSHERGDCLASIPRWGFDAQSGKCVQFIYGGCGGNANNFDTKEECEKRCGFKTPVPLSASNANVFDPVCKLPKEVGPCRASNKRWAFNISKGVCEEFIYGGCRGNANNFESKEACEARCGGSNGEVLNVNMGGSPIDISVCRLPRERGNCGAYLQRWGFDSTSGKCIQFIYSGCGGSANNFETKEACEQKCLASISESVHSSINEVLDPVCQMSQDAGPCRASIRRWSYDAFKGGCVEFIYGGCQGNQNNFESREACETKCGGFKETIATSVCDLPLERGVCRSYVQRWGFDSVTNRCVQFVYGGCGGNKNNFETKEACEQRCSVSVPTVLSLPENANADKVCSLPQDVGPCSGLNHRWNYDASRGGCVEFIYGGCGGNANNFGTKEECEARCGGPVIGSESKLPGYESDMAICRQPHERGDCLDVLERWGFEPSTSRCVQFIYSGCGGNENNFESKEACELRCIAGPPMPSLNAICNLPKEVGPCRGSLRRWAYNASLGRCAEFIYGGCRGNDNNFETKEACENACEATVSLHKPTGGDSGIDPVCKMPQETGPCRASMRRWAYDISRGVCVEFIYGGCKGNENNFESKEACEEKCSPVIGSESKLPGYESDMAICRQPHERGDCLDVLERWGFEPSTSRCVQFIYSGCGGNENNFESKEACELRCIAGPPMPSLNAICNLPKEVGPCRGSLRRWAYNASLGRCAEFIYGGCRGNDNNFETKEACENACEATVSLHKPTGGDSGIDPVCKMPQETGPCRASMRRWAYDISRGVCVEFIYGGCKGNENNFESKEACEEKCSASEPDYLQFGSNSERIKGSYTVDICHLPHERGNCLAHIQRWGFDTSSGKCVQFIFGGCGGNGNNFETREACEKQCLANIPDASSANENSVLDSVCGLPKVVGPCRAMTGRWFYDASNGQCVEFKYGGCGGNANNFLSKEDCQSKCQSSRFGPEQSSPLLASKVALVDTSICSLPIKGGNCRAFLQRWGFDISSKKCIPFVYEGCDGNANNFETKEDCEQRCLANTPLAISADVKDALDPICKLPQDVGPCRAMIKRWFYDTSKGTCAEFYYGGCRGNANNFESKESCEAKCEANTPSIVSIPDGDALDPICKLPQVVGPCRASLSRWAYDATGGKCVEFLYGGCRGNANNFKSKEACEAKCGVALPNAKPMDINKALDLVCQLPQDVGPCRATMKRWYYDASRSSCIEFNYGGCRGNANNFKSKEACEAKCSLPGMKAELEIDVCKLPKSSMPCFGGSPRFYYDGVSGQCLEFNYDECGSNANNFMTMEECEARCVNAL
ncbi:hypothetical protein Aperf_G00000044610 [Anoplocephala perfoliata]